MRGVSVIWPRSPRSFSAQRRAPAAPERGARLKRRRDRLFHARRACQREIIVRCEIDPRTWLEATQPVLGFQGMEGCDIAGNLVGGWIHCSLPGQANSCAKT